MIEINLGNVNSIDELYQKANLAHIENPSKHLIDYLFKVDENDNLLKDLNDIVKKQIESIDSVNKLLGVKLQTSLKEDVKGTANFQSIFVEGIGYVKVLK